MDYKTREDVLRGILDMPLFKCELRQRGIASPIIYEGPGFLSQTPDKSLLLRIFSNGVSEKESFARLCGPARVAPGSLIPDTEYYDFRGYDQNGVLWVAEQLSLDLGFGEGSYITAHVNQISRTKSFGLVAEGSSATAVVPGKFELPWHIPTVTERSTVLDRFEGASQDSAWRILRNEHGLEVHFTVAQGPIDRPYRRFLFALEILTGTAMDVPVTEFVERGHLITQVRSLRNVSRTKQLQPPMRMTMPYAGGAHSFIARFLDEVEEKNPTAQDHTGTIYWIWHRVSKAYQSDLENSALVLSVAIESLLKVAFKSEADDDEEFHAEIAHAKIALEKANFMPRALNRIAASLANAINPGPKQVLRRLKEQGFINDRHVAAWEKMRNKSAHGDGGDDSHAEIQKLLSAHYHCLGLFYCLVFVLIGYRGVYSDLTQQNWPDATFDGSNSQ
ncbi:hypothetical protein [Rudaea sp.]|uniref:hypothetical protein n=1 Tax=Rudaea sp. TaxID=2136325 RepID=UPI002ED2CBAC